VEKISLTERPEKPEKVKVTLTGKAENIKDIADLLNQYYEVQWASTYRSNLRGNTTRSGNVTF